MLCIVMFRKEINTFKAYQVITCLTNRKMVTFGKFTNSRNYICYHVFINLLLIFQNNRSQHAKSIKYSCNSLYCEPLPTLYFRNLGFPDSYTFT